MTLERPLRSRPEWVFLKSAATARPPLVGDGQRVFINADHREPVDGDLVAVCTKEDIRFVGASFFKRFYWKRGERDGSFTLTTLNPLMIPPPIHMHRDDVEKESPVLVLDVTAAAKAGEENVVVVKVFNYGGPGGITRPVKLATLREAR